MTLLIACQDVADAIGLTRPTSIALSVDQLSRQMFVYAKQTVNELGRMDWPMFQFPYTFPTVVGQQQYPVPQDFSREIGDSMYLASQYYQMRGSLSSTEWARQRYSFPTYLGRYKFRIFGLPQMINMQPSPGTVEEVVFEYASTNRIQKSDGTFQPQYTADDDVSIVPEQLVIEGLNWRIRRAKGLDYSEEFNAYEVNRAMVLAQMLAQGSLPVSYRRLIENPEIPPPYIPEFGYGS